MNLAWSCVESSGPLYALWECAIHTLKYGTFSRLYIDFSSTGVELELTEGAAPASLSVAVYTPFPFCAHYSNVLPNYPMFLIVPWQRFHLLLFDLVLLIVYIAGWSPARDLDCSMLNHWAWYSSFCIFAFFVCSNSSAFRAKWLVKLLFANISSRACFSKIDAHLSALSQSSFDKFQWKYGRRLEVGSNLSVRSWDDSSMS